MEQTTIGKFIAKLRKEKNLSQQDLGDIIGVSSKTISKWECGNSLPDISLLEKISKSLDVNIDELLSGKKIVKSDKIKNTFPYLNIIILGLIIVLIIITLITPKINKQKSNNLCTIIRTYYIDSIGKSNNDNYLYITIHEFQVEGTFTIKLPKIVSKDLEVGKSYEFTFESKKEYTKATTDILFEHSDIINVNYTNKEGLERTSKYTCN